MTSRHTSRRALLAGIVATPALAASIVAAASTPALALQPVLTPDDPDAELRRLWTQYCAELDAFTAARAVHDPRRAALNRDLEPFYNLSRNPIEGVDRYFPWGGWEGWHAAMRVAFKKAWRKHKVGGPWRSANRCSDRCLRTIKAIRAIEARTPFGIGIKLAALPVRRDELDREDYVEALQSALPDLDKLCGSAFAEMPAVRS